MVIVKRHNFDEPIVRRGSDARKYAANECPADTIPMWIADTDFSCPKELIDAMVERVQQGHYGYPFNDIEFCKAVAKWQSERFGWDCTPEMVEFAPGAVMPLVYGMRAFSAPGDKVLLQTPAYHPLFQLIENNGRRIARNPLILKDGKYEIDFEDLEKKLSDIRTRVMILCNPQNPTGRVFTKDELLRIGELCLKYGVFVLSDEIHSDIVYSGHKHIPFAAVDPRFRDISCMAINPSKTFNTAGLRTAAFICPNAHNKALMKEVGFDNEYAGAVEAAASTGGQFMPPVMGATAFLIAEILNISYYEIVKAAAIPAILYYAGVLMTVHLNAKKNGLKGVPLEKMPDKKAVLSKVYLAIPLVALLVMMGYFRMTVSRAGLYTIAMTVLLVELSKETRITKESFIRIINGSVNGTLPVAVACASVGIITGVVMATGLAFRLSSILLDLSQGIVWLLLLLTMIASLIMGMGMPTTAAYMVLVVLVVPALVELGVNPLAAHLFVLYFGVISNITPPVALAAYAAAGLSKGNPNKTGFVAFKLAISGFILPFMFVYNNVLMMQGNAFEIIKAFITAALGVFCLSCTVEKYFVKWKISIFEAILLLATAILLIDPGTVTDMIGVVIVVVLYVAHTAFAKKKTASAN